MKARENLSLELSRRQKRLKDWTLSLGGRKFPAASEQEVSGLLQTYRSLLFRLALESENQAGIWKQIEDTERRISSIFSSSHLATQKRQALD